MSATLKEAVKRKVFPKGQIVIPVALRVKGRLPSIFLRPSYEEIRKNMLTTGMHHLKAY